MNKKSVFALAFLALVLAVALSGCMRKPEVCNYDSVCQENETNDCVDCRDVLGRGLDPVTEPVVAGINSSP